MHVDEAKALREERARKQEAKLALIRRCADLAGQGEGTNAIARRLGLNKDSVTKYLRLARSGR